MDQALSNEAGYETDFYAWTQLQAEFLRVGRFDALDVANLVEELEALGRSAKKEAASRLAVILTHLLKWQFQPGFRSRSWMNTIKVQRLDLRQHLEENPSLQADFSSFLSAAFERSRRQASIETGFRESLFPNECPYTFAEILSDTFVPGDGANQLDELLPDDIAPARSKD